ncbi:MAG: hypothetical protein QOJ29_3560 [Thermoleophilaceae bacterium]|nr:hypothetical protein [Thermoleophilaceae bacterium]
MSRPSHNHRPRLHLIRTSAMPPHGGDPANAPNVYSTSRRRSNGNRWLSVPEVPASHTKPGVPRGAPVTSPGFVGSVSADVPLQSVIECPVSDRLQQAHDAHGDKTESRKEHRDSCGEVDVARARSCVRAARRARSRSAMPYEPDSGDHKPDDDQQADAEVQKRRRRPRRLRRTILASGRGGRNARRATRCGFDERRGCRRHRCRQGRSILERALLQFVDVDDVDPVELRDVGEAGQLGATHLGVVGKKHDTGMFCPEPVGVHLYSPP